MSNTTLETLNIRSIVGEIPSYIFECLELYGPIIDEWKHGSKASDFGYHNQFVQKFSSRIEAEIQERVKEARLDVARRARVLIDKDGRYSVGYEEALDKTVDMLDYVAELTKEEGK